MYKRQRQESVDFSDSYAKGVQVIIVKDGSDTVSYTHLDVYKRQTLLLEGILLLPFGFWDRRNAKLFLGVNIGTQLLLSLKHI